MKKAPPPPATFAQSFRQRLVRRYMVRFHMTMLLTATMVSGVMCSKALLAAGVHSVLYRYPLAVLGGYLVFAGLARLWVAYVLINAVAGQGHSFFSSRSSSSGSSGSSVNLDADLLPSGGSGGGGGGGSSVSFGGGDSGGGGASDLWDGGTPQIAAMPSPSGGGGGGGGSWFHFPSLDLDLDFDDGFWILVAIAVVVAVLACVGGYLIWAAPQIMPDLALNALLASSLTGAAKRAQTQGWMVSVLRATCIPLILILAVVTGLAVVVHQHCPGADKLMTALTCSENLPPAPDQPVPDPPAPLPDVQRQ